MENVTIELYEATSERLFKTDKRGNVKKIVHVVRIGSSLKVCASQRMVYAYLRRKGFDLVEHDGAVIWKKVFKSDDEIFLEDNYRKL